MLRRTATVLTIVLAATLAAPARSFALESSAATHTAAAAGAPEARLAEVRAAGVLDAPFPLSHVGVRWVGDETAVIELRTGADGAWGPWRPVTVAHDLGDEGAGVRLSGLLRAERATGVEVRIVDPGEGVADLHAVLIDAYGPRRVVAAAAEDESGAADTVEPETDPDAAPGSRVSAPPIITRAEWGADESLRSGTPRFAPISRLVVHHTVTENNDPDPAATVRAILAYHTRSNGWDDIGYNFLIDEQGRVYEGRYARDYESGEIHTGEDVNGRGVVGAHAANHNTGTAGVSLLGNFTTKAPTSAQQHALTRLLAWKADRAGIDPAVEGSVIGHRDVGATACPGDMLYRELPNIRTTAASIIGSAYGATPGYWVLGRDGRVFAFGAAPGAGTIEAIKAVVAPPAASIASTPTGNGYWVLSSAGKIVVSGDAQDFGSPAALGLKLNAPVVRLEPTPTGKGYWILSRDGGIFTFGDAKFFGSTGAMKLNAPVVGMAPTTSGKGYWLVASDGGIFSFGDAKFAGSTGDKRLNSPIVSMSPARSGRGYWLLGGDGGIFSFGVAYHGSVPGLRLPVVSKVVQIRSTESAKGYYVLGADGGIFTFGDAKFHGAHPLATPVIASDLALMP